MGSWRCAVCITLPQNIQQELNNKLCPGDVKSIMTAMKDMEQRLNDKIEEIKKGNSLPYSNILHSGKLQAKVDNTNKIVKAMAQQNEIKKDSVDEKERMERTLV